MKIIAKVTVFKDGRNEGIREIELTENDLRREAKRKAEYDLELEYVEIESLELKLTFGDE